MAEQMSRRDHIAAMVLQGYLANSGTIRDYIDELAKDAVQQADVLIAELDKPYPSYTDQPEEQSEEQQRETCPNCNGSGALSFGGVGGFKQTVECAYCNGDGKVVAE